MKLTFWGAAGDVTGSMHLVEGGGKRILLDCGLNQGRRKEADRKNRNLPFAGLIDRRGGAFARAYRPQRQPAHAGEERLFAGRSTPRRPRIDLCNWMLRDTAHIQEKDAEFLNKRLEQRKATGLARRARWSRSTPWPTPNARCRCSSRCPTTRRNCWRRDLSYVPYDAGHILGSSFVVLHESTDGTRVRLAFSGDVGRPGLPIIRDPEPLPPADT